ncbi:MAG: hypothetical protein RR341_06790, partial [Bacteroidales bacterium]
SVREFCFNQGIGHATYYNRKKWLATYDKKPMLAPITIKPTETTRNCFAQESSLQKEELQPSYETNNPMQVLEIKYPNGIELRLSSVKLDRGLLETLLNPQAR